MIGSLSTRHRTRRTYTHRRRWTVHTGQGVYRHGWASMQACVDGDQHRAVLENHPHGQGTLLGPLRASCPVFHAMRLLSYHFRCRSSLLGTAINSPWASRRCQHDSANLESSSGLVRTLACGDGGSDGLRVSSLLGTAIISPWASRCKRNSANLESSSGAGLDSHANWHAAMAARMGCKLVCPDAPDRRPC